MKNLFILLLVSVTIFSCNNDDCMQDALSEKVTEGNSGAKSSSSKSGSVDVCHYDADAETYTTISVSESAVQSHLDHGDSLGECQSLSDGGLHFSDGNVVEIDCSYDLPFIHVADDGSTWWFSSPN